MGFKNWSYWLKLGIIFDLILFTISFFLDYWLIDRYIISPIENSLKLGYPIQTESGIIYSSFLSSGLMRFSTAIIFYFVIGAIIGFIVGKIKSNK